MPKKKENATQENTEKQKIFVKEQISKMQITSVEKDLLYSKWGVDKFKTEKEICKILNRKELL